MSSGMLSYFFLFITIPAMKLLAPSNVTLAVIFSVLKALMKLQPMNIPSMVPFCIAMGISGAGIPTGIPPRALMIWV